MKHVRTFLALLAIGIALPACKSPEPTFGVPDSPKKKFGDLFKGSDETFSEKRTRWARREREKSKEMFERMKGDPY